MEGKYWSLLGLCGIVALLCMGDKKANSMSGIKKRRSRRLYYIYDGKSITKEQVDEAKRLAKAGYGALFATWAYSADEAREYIRRGKAERVGGLGDLGYTAVNEGWLDLPSLKLKKQANGKYKAFFIGTRNPYEIGNYLFAEDEFESPSQARAVLKAYVLKSLENPKTKGELIREEIERKAKLKLEKRIKSGHKAAENRYVEMVNRTDAQILRDVDALGQSWLGSRTDVFDKSGNIKARFKKLMSDNDMKLDVDNKNNTVYILPLEQYEIAEQAGIKPGSLVKYEGVIWEVGFVNKKDYAGTVRLQRDTAKGQESIQRVPIGKLIPLEQKKADKIIPEKQGQMTLFGLSGHLTAEEQQYIAERYPIRPAVRLDRKDIYVGKYGDTHSDITESLPKGWWNLATESGWIDQQGNWLTQGQAAKIVAETEKTPINKRSIWQGHSAYIRASAKEQMAKDKPITLHGLSTPQSDSLPPILGWVGGKTKLADKIISMMPPHKVYVEPFLGGGSVFFKKPLAEVNVINDLDKDLMNFYKGVRDGSCEKIRECKLPKNRKEFDKAVENKSRDVCSYLGVNKRAYGSDMDKAFLSTGKMDNNGSKFKESCDNHKDKLKQAKMLNKDYKDVIKKYDSKDTLCYIDPPYADTHGYKHDNIPPEEVARLVKTMKGKAIISYKNDSRARKAFSGLNVHKINTRHELQRKQTGTHKDVSELIITNF